VIATGEQHSVRDFVTAAAKELGIDIEWRNKGPDEIGVVAAVDKAKAPAVESGATIVRIDLRYLRPAEVDTLLGNAAKARDVLGWRAEVSFAELVREMVGEDFRLAQRDDLVKRHGHAIAKSIE
jgi:GDPmannose 4,6-dehydratase